MKISLDFLLNPANGLSGSSAWLPRDQPAISVVDIEKLYPASTEGVQDLLWLLETDVRKQLSLASQAHWRAWFRWRVGLLIIAFARVPLAMPMIEPLETLAAVADDINSIVLNHDFSGPEQWFLTWASDFDNHWHQGLETDNQSLFPIFRFYVGDDQAPLIRSMLREFFISLCDA